ncbi:MAG TPA: PP2C family protein-serine/threonine phosphatase [Bryobacteraceae bacterium]|nr:PP2C family protein-serine/threonine phosphatase [Bryobacteraceae bacterium]
MTADTVVVDVSQDWVGACEVQERFMEVPCAKTQTLMYSGRCRQMRSLGGDCFDFLPLPGRRVALTVADASGKGLPAALIMANVQSSLRTAALFAPDNVAAVVTAVNSQLHASSPANRYATLFYGVFDEDTRTLQYVNAGHNPPMVIRGESVAWLDAGGPPVGLFADTVYNAHAVQLNLDDLFVAYTDGMVEAANTAGDEWGVRGLLGALAACETRQPDRIVQAAFAALDEFSGDSQTDDATMLAAVVN